MINITILENDIKNFIKKIHPNLYYKIIDNLDIIQIHDLFFSSSHDKYNHNLNNNNGIVNYYYGLFYEIENDMMVMLTYYKKATKQNNVPSMLRLAAHYNVKGDYVNEYVYRLMISETQYNLFSFDDNFMNISTNLGLLLFNNNDMFNIYKILGNHYLEQHNYELMEKYYYFAQMMMDYVLMGKSLVSTIFQTNNSKYILAKTYSDNSDELKNLAKYYNIKNDNSQNEVSQNEIFQHNIIQIDDENLDENMDNIQINDENMDNIQINDENLGKNQINDENLSKFKPKYSIIDGYY